MILDEDSARQVVFVTAQYMPARPDMDKIIKDKSKTEGRISSTIS
jgi:hypothetical protein